MEMVRTLEQELAEAEHKAWDSLGRYKFQQFGYWSSIWVHLNKMSVKKQPNPWGSLTKVAKKSPSARVAKLRFNNLNSSKNQIRR